MKPAGFKRLRQRKHERCGLYKSEKKHYKIIITKGTQNSILNLHNSGDQ